MPRNQGMKVRNHEGRNSCSIDFTSKSWLRYCNSTLVVASSGIDKLCKAIVQTKRHYGNNVVAKELGDLALTTAVLERSVYRYAKNIQAKRSHDSDTRNDDGSIGNAKDKASVEIIWKHPGAVLSLLDFMIDAMKRIRQLMYKLEHESTLIRFLKSHRRILIYATISTAGFVAAKLPLQLQHLSWLKAIFSRKALLSPVVFAATLFALFRWVVYRRLRRLRRLHHRLITLVRFWDICMSEVFQDTVKGVPPSDSALVGRSGPRGESSPISISRWMLDLVGVATIWYEYLYDTDRDLWFLWYTYSILYSSVRVWYRVCGNAIKWYGYPVAYLSALYYAALPSISASITSDLLSSIYTSMRQRGTSDHLLRSKSNSSMISDLQKLKHGWRFYDASISSFKTKWGWMWGKRRIDTSFAISRHYRVLRWFNFYCVTVLGMGRPGTPLIDEVTCLHRRTEQQRIVLGDNDVTDLLAVYSSTSLSTLSSLALHPTIIFYIHGGGWVANFLNSDMTFLHSWNQQCGAPVISLDCSLKQSTRVSYNEALNTCVEVYRWIREERGLGFTPDKVIVAGDSLGASLAAALCMRMISTSGPIPDHLLLAYPPLSLSMTSSPSRAVFMMDPIAPLSLLNEHGEWAVREESKASGEEEAVSSSYVSPLAAPKELLACFPSTSILIGSVDPFLDDSVDLAHLLSSNGVFCRLKIMSNLPHGFLCFRSILPRAQEGIHYASQWLKNVVYDVP